MPEKALDVWLVTSISQAEKEFLQKVFSDFGERHNIEIKLKLIPWSKFFSTLLEAFKNGEAPDVFQLGTTWVRTIAHLGFLAEVPSEIEREPLTEWIEKCCQYRGKRIALPWFIEVRSMLVNDRLANKYNVDLDNIQTHENFFKLCQQLASRKEKEPDIPVPLMLPIRPEVGTLNLYMTWLFTSGWEFPALDPIPEKIFGDVSFVNSFSYISRLIQGCNIDQDQLQKHPSVLYDQFLAGRFLFYMGNWRIASLKTSRDETLFSKIPIPVSGSSWRRWGGGSVLCVSSQSQLPELSWELVKYFTCSENIKKWIKFSGELPSFETDFWWENMEKESVRISYEIIQDSESYPFHPLWKRLEDIISEEITNYLWHILKKENASVADSLSILKPLDQKIKYLLSNCWVL